MIVKTCFCFATYPSLVSQIITTIEIAVFVVAVAVADTAIDASLYWMDILMKL